MTGETDTEIPDTGAVFTFGKSKIANNVPSRLWLKNDVPVHISCGQSHSAFVTEQGRLFVFGNNSRGQLGLHIKGPVTKPVCVKVLKSERVQSVACGTNHTLVSTLKGDIFAAGGNSDGQLGLGHCIDSISFQRLHPFCDYAPIKMLSAGGHTSAALTEDGRLFLWGDNSVGQLGLGIDNHALSPKELKLGQPIQWVSCGYRHSALITDNGDVFTFGECTDGRLGLSAHQLANHSRPQRVGSLHRVIQVACGGKHTLALTEDELYCFGGGEFGQLGLGTLVFVADAPVAVGHFRKGRVIYITCGENHSALITDSGLLYTFGDGRHGKLGHGDENFTNQFSPTVCQRFFDYSVMTVACGSGHMLVFARPRHQDSEEVCLEDEDITYSYLDRCYTSMLQGQPPEHIPDPEPALISQQTFIPSSLPTSHRWSLSTRARRRQRESSSAQFGAEFCSLPPLTTGFTALALTGSILQPRSPTDTPKRFRTDESHSASNIIPARMPPVTSIIKRAEDCHTVGASQNSFSDKTLEHGTLAGSVSHSLVTELPSISHHKHKKPRSTHLEGTSVVEEPSFVKTMETKIQYKIYKQNIQSINNKSKGQAVEDKSSPDRMSAKEKECCSSDTDTVSKVDKYSKDSRGQEVTALAKIEQETKSSPLKIVQEAEQDRTTITKVQEIKSPKKVQDMTSDEMEVGEDESTPHAGAQQEMNTSSEKAQEVRSTVVNAQEQGNIAPVKIPPRLQSTPKKGKETNVDTGESPSELTPRKTKKRRSDLERAPMSERPPKTPSPISVSKPKQMSQAKKEKTEETENSNPQLRPGMLAQETNKVKYDSKPPQTSDISFPPIEGAAEKSHTASNLHSEHKNSQTHTDKALTEKKHEFPTIKSLAPERGHSFSSSWSNNQSANNKSSGTKETETSSGKLSPSSSSPQHRHLPLKEKKLAIRTDETKEPVLLTETPQPQVAQSIMGSVVSSIPAVAIASAAPLLIKAAEVISEISPEQSKEMSIDASANNNILTGKNVEDRDSTVEDVSAFEEIDDSEIKQQSAEKLHSKDISGENESDRSSNGKMDEDVKDGEEERDEEKGEGKRLTEEKDGSESVVRVEKKSVVEDEESGSDEEESAHIGEDNEEEESEAAGEEENDNDKQSRKREEKKSEGEGSKEENESEEEGERQESEEAEDKDEERESLDEGSEREVEDEEKTDAEEEREAENSDEEKTERSEESDSEDESKNEEGESEEFDGDEEENETEKEKSDGEEEGDLDESEVRNEEEEEDQQELNEENREQAKKENDEEEDGGEEEEEADKEENQEELEEDKDGVTNQSEDEEGESVKENEEVEDEEKTSETDRDEERQEESEPVEEEDEEESKKEGEFDSGEETFREEENVDISETQEMNKGDEETEEETDQMDEKHIETEEEEEEGEQEDEEAEQTEKNQMEQGETSEEDEEEQEGENEEEPGVKENNGKTRKDTRKQRESSEEEKDQEEEDGEESEEEEDGEESEEEEDGEESEEEEDEEEEQKEKNKNKDKNWRKREESSEEEEDDEEEEDEEEGEEEEEPEKIKKNIKTQKNSRKQKETSKEEEEEEEEREEEEEETEKIKRNIKTLKNSRKQTETSEEEEEEEEVMEDEEEEETEKTKGNKKTKNSRKQTETSEEEEQEEEQEEDEEVEEEEEGEEEEEEEEEEKKVKKVPKQKAQANVPAGRQTNTQRDRQTRQTDEHKVKGKKQTDGAQDPQFWNNVLPQYLNLK